MASKIDFCGPNEFASALEWAVSVAEAESSAKPVELVEMNFNIDEKAIEIFWREGGSTDRKISVPAAELQSHLKRHASTPARPDQSKHRPQVIDLRHDGASGG